MSRLLFLCLFWTPLMHGAAATVLVVPFHNESQNADLNWIGESISETIGTELSASGQIVLDRDARNEGYRRLDLKPDALLTKATLWKLGQTLDADHVCYGAYQISLPTPDAQARDGSIRISARFLDLKKLRDATEFSETGKLADLSRLEEHLAWQTIRYLDPNSSITADQLLKPSNLTRLDAKESYIRGLLSSNDEQRQKWFQQAVALDPQYAQPQYELGKLALSQKQYPLAVKWFAKVPLGDPLYLEAQFRMGLGSYLAGDFRTAETCFRDLSHAVPLNEVFNNLGAAESRLNESTAMADLHHALEGDETDSTYNFNIGLLLYRQADYDNAARYFATVMKRNPQDHEAGTLLARCKQHTPPDELTNPKLIASERLKKNFDITAFRQLKAMLQSAKQ
ncbi:MAG TPA: tetratricopeptide repeat protein [Bryobacteraceae bacterium]|nr:tetratricopeptide repeat protein [Bryobacteraceae bacterium]